MVTCAKCPFRLTSTLYFVIFNHQSALCVNIGIGPLKAVEHYISHYYIPPLPSPPNIWLRPQLSSFLLMTAANPIIKPESFRQLSGFHQRRTTHLVVLYAFLTLCLPQRQIHNMEEEQRRVNYSRRRMQIALTEP